MSTWHAVLGVSPSAGVDEIKRRFRRLTGKHHPDRGGDPEAYRRILVAYREGLTQAKAPDQDPPLVAAEVSPSEAAGVAAIVLLVTLAATTRRKFRRRGRP